MIKQEDIKNQRFPIALGTAILVLIFVINIAFWIGIQKTNTDRDIIELKKVDEALIINEKVNRMDIELLKQNKANTDLVLKELSINVLELKKAIDKMQK